MRDNGNILQQAVSELVGEVPINTKSHLSADELAAYHEGRLTSDEDARLGDHLVACAECTSLLLDLERLQADDLGGDVGTSEFELAAAWRGLGPRLKAEEPRAEELNVEEIQPRRPSRSRRLQPAISLLAASLVAIVGLSTWVHTLRGTLQDLEQRHVNAPVLELVSGVQRDVPISDPAQQGDNVLRLAPDQQFFTLMLYPPYEEGRDEYAIEVSRDGESVWTETGLLKNDEHYLTMTLSRRQLPAGTYQIRLHQSATLDGDPEEEYGLRIEYSP